MFYGNQFAYDNASDPRWDEPEIPEEIYATLKTKFDEDWMAYDVLSNETVANTLLMLADGSKVNDIEMAKFKKELRLAYESELEKYTDSHLEAELKAYQSANERDDFDDFHDDDY
jgi:hypothetical protein